MEFEKKGHLTMAYVKRGEHARHRSFLPEITPAPRQRYQSKETFSSKPTMLKSEGDLRMRNLM